MKVSRILVATDFSTASERAVEAAAHLARREHAELRIVHVAPPKGVLGDSWGVPERSTRAIYRQATEALQHVAERIDPKHELQVSTGLRLGRAGHRILEAAREFNADLMVIGARGEHDLAEQRRALGGTASRVAHATLIPLLLIRRDKAAEGRAVAVSAVDLGPESRRIVQWAIKFAHGGMVHVFHAYEIPFARRLKSYGLATQTIEVYSQDEQTRRANELASLCAFCPLDTAVQFNLERGEPVAATLRFAERVRAHVIVVGKHNTASSGVRATRYGSVCRSIASFCDADVLIVPPDRGGRT